MMSEKRPYSIGIIGSGRMGSDLFDYLSDFMFPLTLICISDQERMAAQKAFTRRLDRRLRNGLIEEELFDFRTNNCVISSSLKDCSGCDIIIEAIYEDEEAKRTLYRNLDAIVQKDTIIVSNSSSIPPSRIADGGIHGSRCAGLHFFFPVRYTNVAELIRMDHTDDDVMRILRDFLAEINRFYLEMGEVDAFVLNRILLDCQAQACRFLTEDRYSAGEIDRIMRRRLFPHGVFEFFDSVGIDVASRAVANYAALRGDIEFYQPMLMSMKKLISENRLGKKTAAGFLNYDKPEEPETDRAINGADQVEPVLAALYINSACRACERGTWPQEDLEYALTEYTGCPEGPFALAQEIGTSELHDLLSEHHMRTGFEAFRPSRLLGKTGNGGRSEGDDVGGV